MNSTRRCKNRIRLVSLAGFYWFFMAIVGCGQGEIMGVNEGQDPASITSQLCQVGTTWRITPVAATMNRANTQDGYWDIGIDEHRKPDPYVKLINMDEYAEHNEYKTSTVQNEKFPFWTEQDKGLLVKIGTLDASKVVAQVQVQLWDDDPMDTLIGSTQITLHCGGVNREKYYVNLATTLPGETLTVYVPHDRPLRSDGSGIVSSSLELRMDCLDCQGEKEFASSSSYREVNLHPQECAHVNSNSRRIEWYLESPYDKFVTDNVYVRIQSPYDSASISLETFDKPFNGDGDESEPIKYWKSEFKYDKWISGCRDGCVATLESDGPTLSDRYNFVSKDWRVVVEVIGDFSDLSEQEICEQFEISFHFFPLPAHRVISLLSSKEALGEETCPSWVNTLTQCSAWHLEDPFQGSRVESLYLGVRSRAFTQNLYADVTTAKDRSIFNFMNDVGDWCSGGCIYQLDLYPFTIPRNREEWFSLDVFWETTASYYVRNSMDELFLIVFGY